MKILLSGIAGHMGEHVRKCAALDEAVSIVCGVDAFGAVDGIPCYKTFDEVKEAADAVVDFSHHAVTPDLMRFCLEKKLPVVVCTTGQTEEEKTAIVRASAHIPVFFSANMSVGVALLLELAKKTAAAFPDADIEIVEAHHNRKIDAPSGTALMIADAIKTVRKNAAFVFGRSGKSKREKNDIGIHAVRAGNIVGIHEVIVATNTQTITLKHEAHDRGLFAEGALAAAKFLADKPAGLYDMHDMLGKLG